MKSMMKRMRMTVGAAVLVIGTVTVALPAQAQEFPPPPTAEQLTRLGPFFFAGTAQRVRATYTRTGQLLLQRTPPLLQVTRNAGGQVCLNRVLNRSALQCNPADRNCANAVNSRLLRELMLTFLDILNGATLVNIIVPPSTAKTNLINSAAFQNFVIRRTLANLLADRAGPFVNFNTLIARAAPTPSTPLQVSINGACDIDDVTPLSPQPVVPPDPKFSFEFLMADTAAQLERAIQQSPDQAAICAPAVGAFGDFSIVGGPCAVLGLVNLTVGGGGAFIP